MTGCSGDGYDASGNMTTDSVYGYSWNAESQLIYSSGGVHYNYDGQGRRASKSSGNAPKLYWYGSGGEILTETNPTGGEINDYIYFGGKRIVMVPSVPDLNGGFEEGMNGWATSGPGTAQVITNSANAHSGSSYLAVSTPSGNTSVSSTQPFSGYQGETVTYAG